MRKMFFIWIFITISFSKRRDGIVNRYPTSTCHVFGTFGTSRSTICVKFPLNQFYGDIYAYIVHIFSREGEGEEKKKNHFDS